MIFIKVFHSISVSGEMPMNELERMIIPASVQTNMRKGLDMAESLGLRTKTFIINGN